MSIEDSGDNARKYWSVKEDRQGKQCKGSGRYWILLFDCTMVMGIYFCVDVPSALQSQLQRKQVNCSSENDIQNRSCCSECLGLGPDRYNQLYAIFSLTNAILVFPAGIFVNRFGNRVSSLIFTGSTLIGSVLFATAVSHGIRGTNFMFILMMLGRMLIGAGTGSSVIVQDRVVFVWFWDKLALAFAILTSTLRIGSVLNFLTTSRVSKDYGLSWALWLGAGMCFVCFISVIIFSFLDRYGSKRYQVEATTSSSLTALKEIRTFPASYWIVCIMIATYYSFLVPFIANGSKFLEDTYGYDRTKAAYINGILYETSILICPVVGQINQKWGLRVAFAKIGSFLTISALLLMLCIGLNLIIGYIVMGVLFSMAVEKKGFRLALATTGSFFTIAVLLLMLFNGISPIIGYIVMGVLYCMAVISLWPCIALIVPLKYVGTANGIAALLQYGSVGITSFSVGKILGHIEGTSEEHRQWLYVAVVLIGHLTVTSICGFILLIYDCKKKTSEEGESRKASGPQAE